MSTAPNRCPQVWASGATERHLYFEGSRVFSSRSPDEWLEIARQCLFAAADLGADEERRRRYMEPALQEYVTEAAT